MLRPDESLARAIRDCAVPNLPGVYLIYSGLDASSMPIYVGRAGTITQQGHWKAQGLAGRLQAKQKHKSRKVFFGELMARAKLAGLTFVWAVTHNREEGLLPCLVEAELLQRVWELSKRLPLENEAC